MVPSTAYNASLRGLNQEPAYNAALHEDIAVAVLGQF